MVEDLAKRNQLGNIRANAVTIGDLEQSRRFSNISLYKNMGAEERKILYMNSPDCYNVYNVEITKDKALEMANLWAKKNGKIVIGEPETLYIVA